MRRPAAIVSLLALIGSVTAQGYSTNFEAFVATPAGTPCAGQDGFFVPPVAGTIDGNIHTYAGNTLGIPANAAGGANFYGGLSAGGTAFARSQRAVTLPSGLVKISYDVCCNYLGAVVPTNNIGSFSFQPSGNSLYVNLLAAYPVGAVFPPTTWDANVVTRGAVPPATVTTVLPNSGFQGLAMGVWHSWSVTINMSTGEHVEFKIRNGVSGITSTYRPTAPLLMPVAPAAPGLTPTDFRFFTGGTTAGNVFAIDNFAITDGPATVEVRGEGCPFAHSFYENFATAAAFDLANKSITMTPTGTGYVVTGGGGVYNPVGSLGAATALVLTDDSVVAAGTLGLFVGSNGWVARGPGNNTTWNISVPIVLGNPSTAFHASHDMNPTIPGSGQVMYEEAGALAQITFNGVWDFSGTSVADANNIQFQIDTATGACKICWGAISPLGASGIGHIVGYSPGGPSVNPGNADLSGLGQITLGTANKAPLRLTATTRPVQGAAAVVYNLTTSNIPAAPSSIHLGIVGLSNPNFPLFVLGMPDCTLLANLDVISAQVSIPSTPTITWSPLTLPALPPSFSGFTFYAQSAIMGTTENTAFGFGALTSNGLKCTIGVL